MARQIRGFLFKMEEVACHGLGRVGRRNNLGTSNNSTSSRSMKIKDRIYHLHTHQKTRQAQRNQVLQDPNQVPQAQAPNQAPQAQGPNQVPQAQDPNPVPQVQDLLVRQVPC
ncbi:hypothetical protein V8G54_020104 [Vigna mungo]|uniref:Uncharacterized protein n=1 Tax=Vigna mungo TaxID=3915 RepID=A0AAQ3NEV9_VIGMU